MPLASQSSHVLAMGSGAALEYFVDEGAPSGSSLLVYHHGTPAAGTGSGLHLLQGTRASDLAEMPFVRRRGLRGTGAVRNGVVRKARRFRRAAPRDEAAAGPAAGHGPRSRTACTRRCATTKGRTPVPPRISRRPTSLPPWNIPLERAAAKNRSHSSSRVGLFSLSWISNR